jgi:hypothetical protein
MIELTGLDRRPGSVGHRSGQPPRPSGAELPRLRWRLLNRSLSSIRAGVRDSWTQTTQEAVRRTRTDGHKVFTVRDIEEGIAYRACPGRLGLILAVETETPPTVVRLASQSTECSALEFLHPIEVVCSQRHVRNTRQPTPFRSAEP